MHKKIKIIKAIGFILFIFSTTIYAEVKGILPEGFCFLNEVEATIIESPRYSTKDNFIGEAIEGYSENKIILTHPAAKALKSVQKTLLKNGYSLVVYDGYRPQRAVDHFVRWSKDEKDQVAKALYYPTIEKRDAFKLGYIAEKSGHSRGSTVDLSIIKLNKKLHPIMSAPRKLTDGQVVMFLDDGTVDMGTSFDLFHPASNQGTTLVNDKATQNRNVLLKAMTENGFKPLPEEWWHFTLVNEPYPDTYFNFIPS